MFFKLSAFTETIVIVCWVRQTHTNLDCSAGLTWPCFSSKKIYILIRHNVMLEENMNRSRLSVLVSIRNYSYLLIFDNDIFDTTDHKMNETFWTNSVNCSGDPSSSLDVFPPRCETPIFTDMSCQNAPTCFAGSETVTLESGNVVPIDSIRVGDRVLAADASGTLSFADVIAVPHAKNSIVSNVVDLTTASGRSVKMTPDHMILAGSCGGNMKSMRADEVLVGSCVYTVDGSEKIARTSLETSASGLYTIITTEEFVVVNGIVASPYAKSHSAGHALYFVHRMIYTLSPALLMNKVFGAVYHSISSLTMVVSF
jgi:hypothetical protein